MEVLLAIVAGGAHHMRDDRATFLRSPVLTAAVESEAMMKGDVSCGNNDWDFFQSGKLRRIWFQFVVTCDRIGMRIGQACGCLPNKPSVRLLE